MKTNITKNQKTIALAGMAVIAVIFAIQLLAPSSILNNQKNTDQEEYGTYGENLPERHPPPRHLIAMYGEPVRSVNDAKQLSLLDVKTPSLIPSNLELMMVNTRIEPENQVNMVTQIYAPKEVTINTNSTFEDVMDNNGMIIVHTKELPGFDANKWIDEYVKNTPGAETIMIHGQKAVGFDGDAKTGKRSQAIFYDGGIQVILVSVGQSKATLIQTAESMK